MANLSIRWKLTAWYAAALIAALGLFSLLIWLSLERRLTNELNENLAAGAARFQNYFTREASEKEPARFPDQLKDELEEFCQALPSTDALELHGANGFDFRYPAAKHISTTPQLSIERDFAAGNDHYRLRISASTVPIDHTLELLRWLLVSLVPVVIAVACAAGAWLSRRALKPVDEITAAARTISIDNLSMRMTVPQTGDELQRLTEVWNTMLERLEGAVGTLSQFAADASHELRTPLAVIQTSAELALRRARSPESYQASLVEISEEAQRMTSLVEDLLFLARHDARAAEMPMEVLDLEALLRETTHEIADVARARQISIRFAVSGTPTICVTGNRAALRRLFLVLLDNAIKYSPTQSEVQVALSRRDDHAEVTVQDFGIGISPADLPHIFKRFYQADRARTDGGFGLGLSLAQTIARAHDAAIEVVSQPGAGSTFKVVMRANAPMADDLPVRSRSQNSIQTHAER